MNLTPLERDLAEVFEKYKTSASAIIVLTEDGMGALASTASAVSAADLTTLFHVNMVEYFQSFARLNGLPHEAALGAMHSLLDMAHDSYVEGLEAAKARASNELDEELRGLMKPQADGGGDA